MKIAIATSGKSLDAPYALHFGRAENFIILDTETNSQETHLNPALGSARNKGVLATQLMIDQQVQAVISGYFGPYAAKKLAAANIRMLLAPTTAGDLLACFRAGQLRQMTYGPTVEFELEDQPMPVEWR